MLSKVLPADYSNTFRKGQGWVQWSPTLYGTTGNPTGWSKINNTSNVYRRVGDLVIGRISFGATTPTAGTGLWYFNMPIPARIPSAGAGGGYGKTVGDWYYYNNGLAAFGDTICNGTQLYMITPINGAYKYLGPGSITTNYTQSGSLYVTFAYEALT